MRSLVLIVCLALAAGAMAEEKPKPRTVVKQIDKSSPAMAQTDAADTDEAAIAADAKEKANNTRTRAQDYNSSRSNTTALKGGPEADVSDFGMSRASERNKGQQGDDASDGKRKGSKNKAGARDYNSSRSNISTVAGDRDRDLGKENRCSIGRLDCDDDDDSVPTRERCGNGIDDDCDSADTRAAPANHNTTRSNRTQPAADGDDPVTRKRPGRD